MGSGTWIRIALRALRKAGPHLKELKELREPAVRIARKAVEEGSKLVKGKRRLKDKLEELERLQSEGKITPQEYEQLRSKLIQECSSDDV